MINKKAALYLHPDKIQQNISVTLKDIKNKREVLFASSSDDELNRLIESAYKYIARLFTEAKEFIKLIEKRQAGGKIKSYKKAYNKVVLGKNRVIYKMDGSKKEYSKSKGM
jgi:mRNA-degrading endonuclease RelE of RelBE toxin-antitoxin system